MAKQRSKKFVPTAKKEVQSDKAPLKIAFCLPTFGIVPAGFMYDLANLSGFVCATIVADGITDIALNMIQGSILQRSREELAEEAIKIEATHMLWFDTDHRFPKDALHRLLNHNVDIVGINYATRAFPPRFVAYESLDFDKKEHKKLVTNREHTGLQEAAAIGFGLTLIRTSVLLDMEKPWFDFQWVGPGASWTGEDVYFCVKARELGFKIYVDADLSNECAHIGNFNYKLEHAQAMRDEWDKMEGVGLEGEGSTNESFIVQRATDSDRILAEPQ